MLLLLKNEADCLTSQLKVQHISVNLFIATDRGAHYRASGLVLVPLRRHLPLRPNIKEHSLTDTR